MRRDDNDGSPYRGVVWITATVTLVGLWLLVAAKVLGAEYPAANLQEYYASLFIPDMVPAWSRQSCCGEADAYWADETDVGPNGEIIAIITDTQDDKRALPNGTFLNRVPVPIGTRVTVPPSKIRKIPVENPTGHTIIFLSSSLTVYCYEPQPLM